jgi:alpha-mannosidase
LAGVLRLRRKLHCSELEQEIWLRRGSRRIDFRTRIRWNEKHKLLKVCFPTSIFAHDAFHEIQFGYLKRPTHRSRQIDQDRFEVCQQKWSALAESGRGIALLNDCKYGLDALGNSLNLTLLRAPQAPDLHADLGEHEFIYSFYSWNGPFLTSNLTREAYQLNIPFRFMKGFIKEDSLINIDAQNVIIDTIKTAEDGSGDFILRCYESAGTETRCRLHTSLGFLHAEETDMLEQVQHRYVNDNGDNKSIALVFRAFEIKTLRLVRASFL